MHTTKDVPFETFAKTKMIMAKEWWWCGLCIWHGSNRRWILTWIKNEKKKEHNPHTMSSKSSSSLLELLAFKFISKSSPSGPYKEIKTWELLAIHKISRTETTLAATNHQYGSIEQLYWVTPQKSTWNIIKFPKSKSDMLIFKLNWSFCNRETYLFLLPKSFQICGLFPT